MQPIFGEIGTSWRGDARCAMHIPIIYRENRKVNVKFNERHGQNYVKEPARISRFFAAYEDESALFHQSDIEFYRPVDSLHTNAFVVTVDGSAFLTG